VSVTSALDDVVITLRGVHKSYSLERRPWRRLWQQLAGAKLNSASAEAAGTPVHHALRDVNLQVRRGEVVGIIGRNGAGKSTLLQLVCGVLQPSAGSREVRGRIAALLELGAGFNPELSGRENVRLNGPLLGLTPTQVEQRLPEIIEFAGIAEYIDQPVRSYSSGMFMRLAFSMATAVEPDILVIDEALAVGDDSFSRKSFARIMALKDRGVTILFCSHALFQVESLCARAIWLHEGRIAYDGTSAQAVVEYKAWIERSEGGGARELRHASSRAEILAFTLCSAPLLTSGADDLVVQLELRSDLDTPLPTVGVVVHGADARTVTAAGSWIDGAELQRDTQGRSRLRLSFPKLALLKGHYTVSAT
jgi:lipopolysaccharide transport system ATP-binding protein